jgi:hypothetical protein
MTAIESASDDISLLTSDLVEQKQPEVNFPSTGPDFYDYECELKAVWKVSHKEDR